MKIENKIEKQVKVPFFARKIEGKRLVVKSGIKAGAMEDCKK
jgi:hypothetical protein